MTNIWTPDRSFYTDQFGRLCQLAAQYEQTVSVEFVTWASVTSLQQAKQLLLDSRQENVGIVFGLPALLPLPSQAGGTG